MMKNDNYYIYQLVIPQATWKYALKMQEKLLNKPIANLNKQKQIEILEQTLHKIVFEFFYNFEQFPDQNLYYYLPCYFYKKTKLSINQAAADLWFYYEPKIRQNYEFSIKNVEFELKLKENRTKALTLLNNDISRYLAKTNYYFEDLNLLGDFDLKHSSKQNISYLDYHGVLDFNNYPFTNLIDWSKINNYFRKYYFKFRVPRNHCFVNLRHKEIKLELQLNSQFNDKVKINNNELWKNISIPNINNFNDLINFKNDVLKYETLIKYIDKKVVKWVKTFMIKNKIALPKAYTNLIIKAFAKHANYLKKDYSKEHLNEFIVNEYPEQKYYFLVNKQNAIDYARITYFNKIMNYVFPQSDELFEKFLFLYEYVKNVDLLNITTNSEVLFFYDFSWKKIEIFNFFVYHNNTDLYKNLFFNTKIVEI